MKGMEEIDRWEMKIPFCVIHLLETSNCHAIGSSEGHFFLKQYLELGVSCF